jgi:imidazolonepropionase-like amidohydrolase
MTHARPGPVLAILMLSLAAPVSGAGDHPFETDALRKPALVTGGSCVIRNVTIHSAVAPAQQGDVLVRDGKIAAVGQVADAAGLLELDGGGLHLAPGAIDCHSHMAIHGGINEGTESITVDCDISDSVDADDAAIFRALAGGTTTARLLHGSANAIGGRHEVIKLKVARRTEELRFEGAPEGVKFALGENPKRSNAGRRSERFPSSRMGVEAVFARAFERALEYQREWRDHAAALARGDDVAPPRRDLRLDGLVGILDGSVQVHSHCYRADEILMLLRTAESYGFKIKTLQHVLEGYKVAHEIARHGAGPSTFSDWWAYKIEAYDAIPFNGALLDEAGAVTSFNSDSDELTRRLYAEAAKGVRYGGMDPVRALRLVTLNPAIQLGIEQRVGSIEVGKDADLVLLTGDPLSSLSRVQWTMVDGEIEFQRIDAFGLDAQAPALSTLEPTPAAQPAPLSTRGVVALVGGTLHPITAPDIENGTLIMRDGYIEALGQGIPIPADARVLDVTGRHVWPGMVALGTQVGLREIDSVAGTVDTSEGGGNQPDVRAAASLNADSAHIAVTRLNGVTRVQSAPAGRGPLRGQSCVMRLTGDTWEELLTLDRDMLHVAFPARANDAKQEDKKKVSDEVKALDKLFEEAREYQRLVEEVESSGIRAPAHDSALAALAPYARGSARVALHVSSAQTILDALRFIAEQKLDAVLYGVDEGWKVAERIAADNVMCVVGPVLTLPRSRFDPYDSPYANAAVLRRAGVRLALFSGDDENPRNLAFHAAMAASFGLPAEEARRAITIHAAAAVGLDDRLGSLTPGKLADVVVSAGDLLEITAPVEQVFIDGVQQPMESRQTELYQRYRERLHRLQKR